MTYLSISLSSEAYVGASTVLIGRRVYPPPSTTNTSARVYVTNPHGAVVEAFNAPVELSGAFHVIFTVGNNSTTTSSSVEGLWVGGAYSVLAYYNKTSAKTTFYWTPSQESDSRSSSSTSSITTQSYATTYDDTGTYVTTASSSYSSFSDTESYTTTYQETSTSTLPRPALLTGP